MTPSYAKFVGHVVDHCSREGVMVLFDANDSVDGCMGLYEPGSLKVAMGNPEWHLVMIHEYAHFLQDRDEKLGLYPGYNLTLKELNQFWQWVQKKKTIKNLTTVRQNVQRMERDAERRSLGLIEQHCLHDAIDRNLYIKKANSYLLFYTYLERETKGGKWYKFAPYRVDAIVNMMPGDALLSDELLEELPTKYSNLIKKECI